MKAQQGFTLIEMVMVILILGVIIGMSSSLLTQGLNTFTTGESIVNADWQGQIAMERMTRDIMLVRSPADITTIAANNFAFTDVDGNTLSYAQSGGNLTLTQNGNAAILADSVQGLAFTYFDENGAVTATPSLVRLIRVAINVAQTDVTYTLTTAIYPRNLQ